MSFSLRRDGGGCHFGYQRFVRTITLFAIGCSLLCCAALPRLHAASPAKAQYSALEAAFQTLAPFLSESSVAVGDAAAVNCAPFAETSRIFAYEENQEFLFAAARLLPAVTRGDRRSHAVRRVFVVKPSLFVIQDAIDTAGAGPVRWTVQASVPGELGRAGLRLKQGEKSLVCNSVADGDAQFSQQGDATYQMQAAGARTVDCVHILSLSDQQGADESPFTVDFQGDAVCVSVTVDDRTFYLTLPRTAGGSGSVAIKDDQGKFVVQRRPLPAGVLPHGPEGVQLMDRWDRAYRDGRTPPWDTGIAAADLKQAVEQKEIKPCRTVVLGCGSGTNAIYLASKGFDVTAIDVSPTALGIARQKAEKAGVEVRWTLADVLAPPDLEPFDFVFDRGCYHNVRYVDAAGFTASLKRLTHPGSRCLILSLNRQGPPGITEQTMREDFQDGFEIRQLKESNIQTGSAGNAKRNSWILVLERAEQQ